MEPVRVTAPPASWLEPVRIGPVALASRFVLAPLAGYTNLPFRSTVRRLGGLGLATTDLVNARAILEKSPKTWELLATSPDDRPWGVQIFGSDAGQLADAAKVVQDLGATTIDINMGCPVRKVVKNGGGSAMMCDTTGATTAVVERVVNAVRVPVTVKMRLGWDSATLSAPYHAREFEKAGVAAVTIHGRTREQGFSGGVDRSGIRAVVEAVEAIPVFANGDVRTVAEAASMIAETGCAGIAIGRGALADPWIFRQLDRWIRTGDPGPRASYGERLDLMVAHFDSVVDWLGSELGATKQFRKVAVWYCKALRAGKKITHHLSMMDGRATLVETVEQLRSAGPPEGWAEADAMGPNIPTPKGPIAHW